MPRAKPASPKPGPDWVETAEQSVLDEALKLAPQVGWTTAMAVRAGAAAGLSAGETELLAPNGAADLAALASRRHDTRALAALGGVDVATLKVRDRIARAVAARVEAAMADEAAVRRLTGFLALPTHVALGLRLAWESADQLWRWAGDTATDENHYSKRLLLAGILAGTLNIRLASGAEAADAFAARRIEDVMAFETWKATTRLRPTAMLDRVTGAISRMRYRA